MKKLLSILLAGFMLSGFGAMAAAQEGEPEPQARVNWNDFYIVAQPEGMTIPYGASFTLSVEVNIPDGVEVAYQWYRGNSTRIEGATGPALHLASKDPDHPSSVYSPERYRASVNYRCIITAYEKDTGGNIISTKERTSEYALVKVEDNTFVGKLFGYLIEPFMAGIKGIIGPILWSLETPVTLILSLNPLWWVFVFLYEAFRVLLSR